MLPPTEPARSLQAAVPVSDQHQYVNSASQKSQAYFEPVYAPRRHVTVGNSALVLTAGALSSNTGSSHSPAARPLRQCHIGHRCNGKVKGNLVEKRWKGWALCLDSAQGCSETGFGEGVRKESLELRLCFLLLAEQCEATGLVLEFDLALPCLIGRHPPPKFGASVHGI